MKYNLTTFVLPAIIWLCCPCKSLAQSKGDTLQITPEKVNTKVLKTSSSRYIVYFIMGKDAPRSRAQFWTIKTEYADYNGRKAIVVNQEWEDRDTIAHIVQSVCDQETFAPLYHKSWWKGGPAGEFDFINQSASLAGAPLSDEDTARNRKGPWMAFKAACKHYVLNWHLDLITFPLLPYKEGITFSIPFYDPGQPAPRNVAYTVTGSAELEGYNNQKIDCWLLTHESRGLKGIFWISKKTKEVLKLEEEIGKDKWRYKIKLGFSI